MKISLTPPTKKIDKKSKSTSAPKKVKNTNTQKNLKTTKYTKRYRGKGKTNRRDSTFTVLLSNIRGYKSKENSLKKIIKKVTPSMILLNETQLVGKMNVSLKPYTSWTRNRTEKGGGGIATAVSQAYKNHAVGAGEGEQDDEFLITRIDAFTPALNVVNSYGEQRSTRKEDIEERWLRLRKELEKVRNRGEFCLWAGDQNKLVGTGELGVPGNNPEVSLGGRLLRDLLATKDWVLVNGLGREVVEGGPHTRKDPATGNMSCLDMFVVSRELLPYVDKLIIDKDRKITPARAIKSKGKYKLAYTDHFSMLLTMNNLPKKKEIKQKKRKVWNLAKENGWKLYREISNEFSDKLNKVIDDEELNIEETMRKFDKIHNDIK